MNSFIKAGSIAAFFSLFLNACDQSVANNLHAKANEHTQESAQAQSSQQKGNIEYQKLQEWQKEQEEAFETAITQAVNALGENPSEEAVYEATEKAMIAQIEGFKQSALALHIVDPEINQLKEKMLEIMVASLDMLIKPNTEEEHKLLIEKATKVQKIAEEGQKLQKRLDQKYLSQ